MGKRDDCKAARPFADKPKRLSEFDLNNLSAGPLRQVSPLFL